MQLSISDTRDYFVQQGRPFFYLADTVWAAFTNASVEERRDYLAYRRRQGFTALQISVLPILHDRSAADSAPGPVAATACARGDTRTGHGLPPGRRRSQGARHAGAIRRRAPDARSVRIIQGVYAS